MNLRLLLHRWAPLVIGKHVCSNFRSPETNMFTEIAGLWEVAAFSTRTSTYAIQVRIHFIIVMIRWTGLAPWEFEFPFPGSLIALPNTYAPSIYWHPRSLLHSWAMLVIVKHVCSNFRWPKTNMFIEIAGLWEVAAFSTRTSTYAIQGHF